MKRILVLLCTFSLCLCAIFSPCAFTESALLTPGNYAEESSVSPRTEEKIWIQRIYNGYRQKRLWSITYNKWLTDWITIGPV